VDRAPSELLLTQRFAEPAARRTLEHYLADLDVRLSELALLEGRCSSWPPASPSAPGWPA
jgi:hypothetical protein